MEDIEFDAFLADFEIPELPEVTFVATYNPTTGEIISVGPAPAFTDEQHKIDIDSEIASDIISGKMQISSCFVDLASSEFSIVETKNIFKIDDVLHRITLEQWAPDVKPDILVTYNENKQTMRIQMSEEYFGTLKMHKKYGTITQRKTKWSGDTQLVFIATKYNDPHVIYSIFTCILDELTNTTKEITNVVLPKKFSIYTRRIFKNYIMDVK